MLYFGWSAGRLLALSCQQDMMNRENSNRLPYMQVEYIDDVCCPLYKVRHTRL